MEGSFEIARVLQVVLGIGLVIFVHELGHYIAARLCGVRVETFSLGFGPRLFSKRIGPTDYQIALVPLGGFCRMAGEERRYEGLPPEPDELPAKSVGQRFFIYSGGVLMNLLFGVVVFPILFQVGVPFTRPVIGDAEPGGAAWRARIPEGAEVRAINGNRVFEFAHLYTEVALGDPEHTELELRDPRTGEVSVHELVPERDEREGFATIDVRPDFERDEHGHILVDVTPDTPAARAGLTNDDRLVEILDGAPGQWPLDQLALLAGRYRPWRLLVGGPSGTREVTIKPELSSQLEKPRLGISARVNRVVEVRPSALSDAVGLEAGDRLLDVDGSLVLELGDFTRALLSSSVARPLHVLRDGAPVTLTVPVLTPDEARSLGDDVYIASDPDSTAIVVQPDEAGARAGLATLDEVLQIDGTEVHSWSEIFDLVGRAGHEDRPAVFRVARPGAEEHLTIHAQPEARPRAIYGLFPRQAEYVYRSANLPEAIGFGAECSWRFLEDSWLTLKRMLTRDVSPKNMGGIITISAVSYSLTEAGWVKLFFFLCLVSINLAFLNVLPIPVLDGGHLLFLIVEKLKGSPVSNRVLSASQAVGVVLLLSLMIYVTYNDLVRWVFPQE